MRRAAKVDAGQTAIVEALRAAGAFVQSTAAVGAGCPDLLASYRGRWYVIECKEPGGKLTPKQKDWHRDATAPVHLAYSADDALMIVGATNGR